MCPLLPFDEEADDGIRHKLSELSLVPKSIEFRLSLLLDFFIELFLSLALILLLSLISFSFLPPPLVVLIKRGIRALVGLEIKGSSVVSNELLEDLIDELDLLLLLDLLILQTNNAIIATIIKRIPTMARTI